MSVAAQAWDFEFKRQMFMWWSSRFECECDNAQNILFLKSGDVGSAYSSVEYREAIKLEYRPNRG